MSSRSADRARVSGRSNTVLGGSNTEPSMKSSRPKKRPRPDLDLLINQAPCSNLGLFYDRRTMATNLQPFDILFLQQLCLPVPRDSLQASFALLHMLCHDVSHLLVFLKLLAPFLTVCSRADFQNRFLPTSEGRALRISP